MSKNGKGCSGNTHTQSQMNHHANQCNPNNSAHTAAMNNHANQCNPNHNASKRQRYQFFKKSVIFWKLFCILNMQVKTYACRGG